MDIRGWVADHRWGLVQTPFWNEQTGLQNSPLMTQSFLKKVPANETQTRSSSTDDAFPVHVLEADWLGWKVRKGQESSALTASMQENYDSQLCLTPTSENRPTGNSCSRRSCMKTTTMLLASEQQHEEPLERLEKTNARSPLACAHI